MSKLKLTAASVAALKDPGTYSDQQTPGLTLKILKSGYRGWYFIYRRGRISRALVLGPASVVTLKEARLAAHGARRGTAQRGSEVQHMRWDEIHGGVWTIPAERSKNKREHRVPLSALALEILASVDRLEARLFPYRPKPLGVAGARGHDLRRTAASRMAELGVARVVLARILNHTDASVTGIYDRHSYFPEMRAALERWAVEITHLISRI